MPAAPYQAHRPPTPGACNQNIRCACCHTQVIIGLLRAAMLKRLPASKDFLIDGFPRALDQAKMFEKMVKEPQMVIAFDCPQVRCVAGMAGGHGVGCGVSCEATEAAGSYGSVDPWLAMSLRSQPQDATDGQLCVLRPMLGPTATGHQPAHHPVSGSMCCVVIAPEHSWHGTAQHRTAHHNYSTAQLPMHCNVHHHD